MNSVKRFTRGGDFKVILLLWIVAGLILYAVASPQWEAQSLLNTPEKLTGYSLFTCIMALGFFRVRKHLSMLSFIRVRWWFAAHSIGGLLAFALYIVHVDSWWPEGGYVQLLAALMIALTISGLIGYVIEKTFPERLTQQGGEILFSQIPEAVHQLKAEAENLMLEMNRKTGNDTLARHYLETLKWFFKKPRFIFSHILGGRRAQHWLLLHVPLSALLVLLSLWHLLLVNIYVL
jgi:hypothetical protein